MECFDVLLAGQSLALGVPSRGASLMEPLLEGMRKEEEMNILCVSVCASFLWLPNKLPRLGGLKQQKCVLTIRRPQV